MRLVSCAWGAGLALVMAAGCSLVVDADGLSGGTDAPDAADAPSPPPPPPVTPPPLPDAGDAAKEGGRVSDGLLALYTFRETSGTTVHDVSGVPTDLDVTIVADGGVATFTDAGLAVTKSVLVTSQFAATKIINACKASHEVTLELWVTPANDTQDFARMVGVSGTNGDHDVALNQSQKEYFSLMRTAAAPGHHDLHAPGTLHVRMQHVVITRAKDGARVLYVDGVAGAMDTAADTDPAVWNDTFGVTMGNSASYDAPWLGTYHLVAIYSRALSAQEIAQNFGVGPR
jgi:hypothetical protein